MVTRRTQTFATFQAAVVAVTVREGEKCADPEAVGEGLRRCNVLEVVGGGGGGVEEVGVRGGGGLGAEAEREGELEMVGLLRLLRPALAAAARRAVRVALVPVLCGVGEGGGDGGGYLAVVAPDAAPAGLPLQPQPVRDAELGAVPVRLLLERKLRGSNGRVERGGPVVVGRGRGRVVRRAAVVAGAGGRGGREEGVRRPRGG